MADFYTQYKLSYLMFVPNFKILGQVVLEKSLTKISICITLESERWKKEKIEKEGKIKSQHLSFASTWLSSLCIQNLKTVALIDAELIRWQKCWKERKKDK